VLCVGAAGGSVACIAIDVLKMVRPGGQDRKAAYDRDYEALVGLRELSKELGIAIIVAHHTRKTAADDLIDMVSGTLGLTGAADTIIVIERQPSGGFVLDVRGRDVEATQLVQCSTRKPAAGGSWAMPVRSDARPKGKPCWPFSATRGSR
jgi:hypothetical protein